MARLHACVFAALVGCVLPSAAFADQCARVDAQVAERAATLLRSAKVLQEICRPCGETKAKALYIDHVVTAKASDPRYDEVLVNGRALDLADVFVMDKADRDWINVGLQVQCGADVSRTKRKLAKSDLAR
jgi:hypothetical protein